MCTPEIINQFIINPLYYQYSSVLPCNCIDPFLIAMNTIRLRIYVSQRVVLSYVAIVTMLLTYGFHGIDSKY